MPEFNLLHRYPSGKRNIQKRSHTKTAEHIRKSREYGYDYFDGEREYGYGGYRYDGRWVPIAEDIVSHFNLKPGMRILDVGCAKGFLVKDLSQVLPGLEAFGLDISEYAIKNCEPEVSRRLILGSVENLPFHDNSFDAVICINTVHNLERPRCIRAVREVERVARNGHAYIQVDSYRTPEEKEMFEDWVLTAYTHDYPKGWETIFNESGFTGDYYWTFITG